MHESECVLTHDLPPGLPAHDAAPMAHRRALRALGWFALVALLWILLELAFLRHASARVVLAFRLLTAAGFGMGLFLYLSRVHHRLDLQVHQVRDSARETRDYLVTFFDQMPMGAMILTPMGHMQHVNRRAISMLGLPEEVLRATDWTDPAFVVLKMDGNPMEIQDLPMNRVLDTRTPVRELVIGLERPDGDWAWVSTTSEPRFDRNGDLKDVIILLEDVTRRRAMEAELALQTFRDRLTGLPNRALFMERLSQALLRTGRRKVSTAVLFLDLDRFKVINDSLSHESGDNLLVQVSKRIRHCMRPEDTVARLGGDEFVVLFEDLGSLNDALHVAERISQSFREAFSVHGQELFTTCSMGLALADRPETVPSELVRDAEVAMYRAKAKGEATIEVFDPSMNEKALARLQMEAELRRAIERKEFVLYYQPVVGLTSMAIEGWEALVRWKHPERGMVPPLDFITLAEETGLIVPIGKWVLEEACRQAALWNKAYPSDPPRLMNVNISGRQFSARDLVDSVTSALDAHALPPRNLKLEITESVMMKDPQASLEAMKVFRSLNIHLVIDDFGTGYSSLSYLRRFPVDTLKVDKSFVDGLGLDQEATAIVQAVISLAHSLGMRVVAEGIESRDQMTHLQSLDCDQGQGYHFSRPLPADAAEALLARDPHW